MLQLTSLWAADTGIPQHFHISLLGAVSNHSKGRRRRKQQQLKTHIPFCRLLLQAHRGLSSVSTFSLLQDLMERRTLLNWRPAGSRLRTNQLSSDLATVWPVTPWRGREILILLFSPLKWLLFLVFSLFFYKVKNFCCHKVS